MSGQAVDSEVRVRGNQCGVLLRVWGWDEAKMALHDALLDQVIAYVVNAFQSGLHLDEIADDLLQAYGRVFQDADLEVDESDEITVLLVPADA